MNSNRVIPVLLWLSNLAFLFLYITLCWNNRIASDDYYFLYKFNDYGITGAVQQEYVQWGTRYASNFLTHLVLGLDSITGKGLFIFGILNIILFTGIVWLLLNSLKVEVKNKVGWSLFLAGVLFISTYRIGETWFWLCASCTYVWCNMMLLLGAAWIIHPNRSWLLLPLGCIGFIFVGGSSEPVAIITLFLLAVFFLFQLFNDIDLGPSKRVVLFRTGFAFILCAISFYVLYSGPGLRKREAFFEDMSYLSRFMLHFKMTGIILLKRIPFMLPYVLVPSVVALWIGRIQSSGSRSNSWKKGLFKITILYLVIIFLYQLPISFRTYDTAANRALFFVTIVTTAYVFTLFYVLGKNLKIDESLAKMMSVLALLISIGCFCFYGIEQIAITTDYAKGVDKRMKYVRSQPENSHVSLQPLPPSGFLYSAELSSDSMDFRNIHFARAMHLATVKVNF